MDEPDLQDMGQETPVKDVFIAPSIHEQDILAGASYTHHTSLPDLIAKDSSTSCVIGVDEAGRGPVLGNLLDSMKQLSTYDSLKDLWSTGFSTSHSTTIDPSWHLPTILMTPRYSTLQSDPYSCISSAQRVQTYTRLAAGQPV